MSETKKVAAEMDSGDSFFFFFSNTFLDHQMHHSYLECVLVYILTEGLNQYRRPLKWLLPRSRSQDTEPLEGARTETN